MGDDEEEIRAAAGCPSTPTSRRRSWPGCWSTTTRWAPPATPGRCGWARSTPSSAIASAPASRPMPRPRPEPSSTPSARPASTPGCASASASRRRCCPRSATRRASSAPCATRVGRSSCRCGPGGRPAGCARGRRVRCAGPRQGDLRDRRLRPRPRRRRRFRRPRAASCRPSPGASTAASSTRSTAASSPPGRCSSGSVASSAWRRPPALGELARERRRVGWGAGAAGAGRARSAVVAPERPRGAGGDPRRHHARQRRPGRARGDRLAGRRHRRRDPRDRRGAILRVDGGLTNEPLCSSSRRTRSAHRSRQRARMRRCSARPRSPPSAPG